MFSPLRVGVVDVGEITIRTGKAERTLTDVPVHQKKRVAVFQELVEEVPDVNFLPFHGLLVTEG